MKVVVATCQLPTSADTEANLHHVLAQMREAKAGGAQVAHFREGCLSGYAGTDFKSLPTSTGRCSKRVLTKPWRQRANLSVAPHQESLC
jgi:predicted amidohydrolase